MKKGVVLILIDGFRHDYLNPMDAPFLHQLAERNIDGIVRETFAFELRPAFFAGLQPDECGVAHMFYYNPKDSPFRAIDIRDGNRSRITRALKAEAERRGYSLVKYIGGCCEIPLPLLKYFDFSEKYYTADPDSLGAHKTLFDYLREDEKRWLWIAYPDGPGTTVGVLDQFNGCFSPDINFFYLHFSELDWAGHQFGPHSDEQRKVLREIDEAIRKVYARLNQNYEIVQGIIFGDHGQVGIKKNIDIESLLRESGLVLEKDYVCFLDSTQARFWCFNDGARNRIVEMLSENPDGTLLSEADYERLHFRFSDRRFGELIFVTNDETGIFPNYFQRQTAFKGLHGFLPEVEGNWAKLIISGCHVTRKLTQPIELVDLFPTLLELFGYRPPADARERSLFQSASIDRSTHRYIASVIMPTFNRLTILQESVQAIENQTASRDDFELIVVDDGSDDGTLDFLADYESKTALNFRYLTQTHSGPAAARNFGITGSSGEVTILLGDDMLAVPTLIADHLRFHREYPMLSHSCVGFIDWEEGIEVNGLMRHVTSNAGAQQFNFAEVESQNSEDVTWGAFWSGNLSFKKSFVLTHGLFNAEVFKHAVWEDIELGYRLHKAGLVLHFRKECKVNHKHVLTLEGFAERQRLVGWYTLELEKLGVPVKAWRTDYDPEGYWSKKALQQTTDALRSLERQSTGHDGEIPARVYNAWLDYAARVGYAERENVSQDQVDALTAHLHNLSLVEQKNESLEEENQRLRGQVQELQERTDRLQLFSDAVRRTFVYRMYRKFLRPLGINVR
jgi:glycosyltransferase involved in cell wall biosynthesis/predicted AlkP superfamily pyrophosphatase or phosphodiesterase